METIITQITVSLVEEILKSIEKNGISDIGKTAESLLLVLKGARGLTSVGKGCRMKKKKTGELGYGLRGGF